jgi:hypothetical protein
VTRRQGDRLEVFERTVAVIVSDPGLGFEEIRRRVGGRDADVRRVLRGLRAVQGLPLPEGSVGRPKKPLPHRQSDGSESDEGASS